MKVLSSYLLLFGLLAGCTPGPVTEANDPSEPGARRVVSLPARYADGRIVPEVIIAAAMPMNRVLSRLRSIGARDVSHTVGIKVEKRLGETVEQLWFVIPGDGDGTCVRVIVRGAEGSVPMVTLIEVGQSGEGYPGKVRWSAVKRQVPRLDLTAVDHANND